MAMIAMKPRALPKGRDGFPRRLTAVGGAPDLLWVRGPWDGTGAAPAVAMVGSRAAAGRSLKLAAELSAQLALAGVEVISGGALGVDAAAHEGALDAGGVTVAVLGTGVDVTYPVRHARLFQQIEARGALVSQFPLGTQPLPGRFPVRNAVIAGLSDAVIVVAAAADSGSLHTARAALRLGRKLLAVSGTRGTDELIVTGQAVGLCETPSAADVLAVLDGRLSDVAAPALPEDPDERRLYDVLDRTPRDVGELAHLTGLRITTCAAAVVDLELRGLIARAAGGRYLRLHREDRL